MSETKPMPLFDWVADFLDRLIARKPPQPAGYLVQKIGRDEYRYHEGERSVRYQVDMEFKPGPDRRIYKALIREWEAPHENDPFTNEDRERILARPRADFERQGLTYVIEDDPATLPAGGGNEEL